MATSVSLWFEYILRFSHLVAGIAWIGSSFYFIWMDSSFEVPESPRKNVEGELYMVHGGFYYHVEKRKIYPGEIAKTVHWFKWEATLTWATGFLLFIYLYYLNGASLMIDRGVMDLTQPQAVGLSLGILVGSWLIYDLLWNSAVIPSKKMSTFLSVIFFSGLIIALTRIFSGRGAFILTGVIFGSLMLLNVWIRILPGQAKMFREAQAGQIPDYSVSLKSKTRSVHNTYFIFPVLFIMLSNHYPTVYNHPLKSLLLILLAVAGAMTRHAMVTKNKTEKWVLVPAAVCMIALIAVMASPQSTLSMTQDRVDYQQISPIIERRCLSCHSTQPTDDLYKEPPKGVLFGTEAQLKERADKVYLHVVLAKSMPLGNKTQMLDTERALIGRWLKQEGLAP